MEGEVSSNFFRIDGADSESGQETFLVLRAKSKPHAERLARRQGLLISSVRVAKPADWKDAPHKAESAPAVVPGNYNNSTMNNPEPPENPLAASAPLEPLPRPSDVSYRTASAGSLTGASSWANAGPILLFGVAGALIVGGALALALALWPDDGVRNELQQVDFRLHEVSQTVLGSMLVLGGLIVGVLAAVLYAGKLRNDE